MSVKDQPAIAITRLAQHALKFVLSQCSIGKLDDLEKSEINGSDVDAFVYSTATVEPILKLELARQGNAAERIGKIRQLDIAAQPAQ